MCVYIYTGIYVCVLCTFVTSGPPELILSAITSLLQRRPTRWPIMAFRRGSNQPSYAEVEAPSQDKDCALIIHPKQSFALSDRRESEQKDGFIVADQRERFLVSEST